MSGTRLVQTAGAAELARCVAGVEAALDGVFSGLRTMAAAMEARWRAQPRPFTTDDILAMQPRIFEQLDAQPAFDSAGYVMAEAALAAARRHLEWWHRGADHSFHPLILNVEPGAPDAYDYYSMDWFAAAVAERRRFVSGPHIDLPCADVCIMTFTEPVVVAGPDGPELLGVAGADVALARFESQVLPPLRRLGIPAVLVNPQRRVITSNDPAWISGEKLARVPVSDDSWQAVWPVTADLGWTLAVGR